MAFLASSDGVQGVPGVSEEGSLPEIDHDRTPEVEPRVSLLARILHLQPEVYVYTPTAANFVPSITDQLATPPGAPGDGGRWAFSADPSRALA